MELSFLVDALKSLLINYTSNNSQIDESLNDLFSSLESKNLNKELPNYIIEINNMIDTMPEDLIQNLLALELNSDDKLIIKFKNYDIEKINDFINKNNILKQETNLKNNILSLTIGF